MAAPLTASWRNQLLSYQNLDKATFGSGTTAEREAVTLADWPDERLFYDTTDKKLYLKDGNTWAEFGDDSLIGNSVMMPVSNDIGDYTAVSQTSLVTNFANSGFTFHQAAGYSDPNSDPDHTTLANFLNGTVNDATPYFEPDMNAPDNWIIVRRAALAAFSNIYLRIQFSNHDATSQVSISVSHNGNQWHDLSTVGIDSNNITAIRQQFNLQTVQYIRIRIHGDTFQARRFRLYYLELNTGIFWNNGLADNDLSTAQTSMANFNLFISVPANSNITGLEMALDNTLTQNPALFQIWGGDIGSMRLLRMFNPADFPDNNGRLFIGFNAVKGSYIQIKENDDSTKQIQIADLRYRLTDTQDLMLGHVHKVISPTSTTVTGVDRTE